MTTPTMSPSGPDPIRRISRVLTWSALTFLLLLIGGCVLENWRGHYLWKKYRQAGEAKGERYDLAAQIPKPVPPEQNFAMTPFFAPFLDYSAGKPHRWVDKARFEENQTLAGSLSARHPDGVKPPQASLWDIAKPLDLGQWQDFFHGHTNFPIAATRGEPARDVLAALRRYDGLLEELRTASARPYSVFPVHYEEHFNALLPHLASMKGIAQIVRLRAVARLEAGQPAEALQDVQLGLRLAESTKADNFLISHLVRFANLSLALQPVWEGLARSRWNEAQLAETQSALARVKILEDYGPVMRMERAAGINFLELMRTGQLKDADALFEGESSGGGYGAMRFLPGGFFRHNQLSIARSFEERFFPLVDVEKHRVDVQLTMASDTAPEFRKFHPYTLFARLLLPALSKCAERFSRSQCQIDLAVMACALERHRLAAGSYPDSLDALVPKLLPSLPPDIINGQPLRYRRTDDGRFVLYSVGWNERDDDGVPGLAPGKKAADSRQGDWVWRYSTASVTGAPQQ